MTARTVLTTALTVMQAHAQTGQEELLTNAAHAMHAIQQEETARA